MSTLHDANMSPSGDIWMTEFVFSLQTNTESSGPTHASLGSRIERSFIFVFLPVTVLNMKLDVVKVTLIAVHADHPGRPWVAMSVHYECAVVQVTDGEAVGGNCQRLHQRDFVVSAHCQQADGSVIYGYCNIVIRPSTATILPSGRKSSPVTNGCFLSSPVFTISMNNEATSDLFRRRQGPHLLPVLSPTASLPNSRSVSANPPVAIVF
ncbi:hypothetical protein MAR_014530 [Mya arenaria]|uniref:Uncharacterized protein n=1 Tax=Mya arenaria TaxID=6604 RepID=A0ABY7GC93_MYAAR|nr:hypothetical protein MAR_014530 [Mya arenaria]